jgi:hypothetical protein
MSRIVAFLLLGLTLAALLPIVVVGVLLSRFDPNAYRDELSRAAETLTGRKTTLQEPLKVSYLPSLELRTGAVAFYDQSGEVEFEAGSIALGMPFAPLLQGVLEIREITLRGARPRPGSNPLDWFVADQAGRPAAGEVETGGLRFVPRVEKARLVDSDLPLAADGSLVLHLDEARLDQVRFHDDLPLTASGALRDAASERDMPFSLNASVRLEKNGDLHARVASLRLRLEDVGDLPLLLEAQCALDYTRQSGLASVDKAQGSLAVLDAPTDDAATRAAWRGYLNITARQAGKPAVVQGALHAESLNLDVLLRGLDPAVRFVESDGEAIAGAPNLTRPKVNRLPAGSHGMAQLPAKATTVGRPAQRDDMHAGALPLSRRPLPPEDLSLDLALSADTLIIQGLPLLGLDIKVRSRDRQTSMPFAFTFCGADVNGTGRLDCQRSIPSLALVGQVRGLNMRLFGDAWRLGCDISGVGSATLEVSGLGLSYPDLMRSLRGKASFQVVNGQIRDFSLIPADLPSPVRAPREFLFRRLAADARIMEGTAVTDNITLESDSLSVTGGGSVHLAYRQLDIGLNVMLGGKPPIIPVSISGPWKSLSYQVDRQALQRNMKALHEEDAPEPGEIYIDDHGLLRTR